MKRFYNILIIVVIAVMAIGFNSCASHTSVTSKRWLEYELPPSKIIRNGEVFFGARLSDGTNINVFADKEIDDDAKYYYVLLMQDFGWKKDDEGWTAPQGARNYKLGHIYINPSRQVAVYFYPDREYSAFKTKIGR